MTISAGELGFYIFGLFVLFMTPGPVWVALTARVLSGGFKQALPLMLGVAIGDIFWSVLAALGMGWFTSSFGGAMIALKWVAACFFIAMAIMIIRSSDQPIESNHRLTRPGLWAGFAAGLLVILANPKAILFYMGVLPGFFELSALTLLDVIAIGTASFVVPLTGNFCFALFVDRARRLLTSPTGRRRMNWVAGGMLIIVGIVIAFV